MCSLLLIRIVKNRLWMGNKSLHQMKKADVLQAIQDPALLSEILISENPQLKVDILH